MDWSPDKLTPDVIGDLLSTASETTEAELFRAADERRRECVGDEVHLRGLIEFSNRCACHCLYCGLRAANREITRFQLTADQILEAARLARRLGYGTVVMQSGEDEGADVTAVAAVVRTIKEELGLGVTLSMGELEEDAYQMLRAAGADRYLLKHETANPVLFRTLRPGHELSGRVAKLRLLRRLGFQIGGGSMVGLPGQSVADLVADLQLLRELDIDMAGIGPFVPAPGTPLWGSPDTWPVERRIRTTYRMMALLRLLCPLAHIPVTTALSTLDPAARANGLTRGANVIMPNVGQVEYRREYRIYPGKAGLEQTAEAIRADLMQLLERLGRPVAAGPGHSRRGTGRTP